MRRKEFRHRAGLALLERLNLFEEINKGSRIVAGLVHVLDTEVVRFRFEATGELQERQRHQKPGCLIDAVGRRSTNEDERQSSQLRDFTACGLTSAVTGRYVSNLVRHDSGEFGFVVRVQNQARIHKEESTRKRERVHRGIFYD